ncbi:MAG: BrxA/BrxB family bacilliredoxin [Candidatus Krumholzibacteria bacterium]|nr:BrxA/BrxB family bacilliredoxin [Candidatus Krumholzibacteria bacterium]MDH4337588.1 BrxA/BrxB family bacilliredoxin [Candidatus Krumholzibacteria bacterium]MDH5270390.1 BrxA/BrxB family bacilliredoxin [Candidatus Krumholzibacteria bacterium]
MLYPPEITEPCRQDLTQAGIVELRTPQDVDLVLKDQKGTALVVVNSVCGCAAGMARPGVKLALQHDKRPDKLTSVFAGVDSAATEQARKYIIGYAPSSPSIALFKDGNPVFVMERWQIEGRSPQEIAFQLVEAFDEFC